MFELFRWCIWGYIPHHWRSCHSVCVCVCCVSICVPQGMTVHPDGDREVWLTPLTTYCCRLIIEGTRAYCVNTHTRVCVEQNVPRQQLQSCQISVATNLSGWDMPVCTLYILHRTKGKIVNNIRITSLPVYSLGLVRIPFFELRSFSSNQHRIFEASEGGAWTYSSL